MIIYNFIYKETIIMRITETKIKESELCHDYGAMDRNLTIEK